MLKTLIFLNPVYVTLFWAVTLNLSGKKSIPSKNFLGKFMIFAFIVYFSHFLFYTPFPELYSYIDPLYQFASLMVYPMYYVYIKLLTIEEKFLFYKQLKYFIIPVVLFALYLAGIIFSNPDEYRFWLYNRNAEIQSAPIYYLRIIYAIIRIVFVTQLFYLMYVSSRLLFKYSDKAGQFYSDIEDGKVNNVSIIHISMLLTGIFSIIISLLGRSFFINELFFSGIVSVLFSGLLFTIGYLGMLQKAVNPTFEKEIVVEEELHNADLSKQMQNNLIEKILDLFQNQKIYLNEELNIVHLANLTGSNRTYISQLINKHYQQNFCTFVNTFRIKELRDCIRQDSQCTNQILAEKCGFSSTDSLKRVVKNHTGMSVTELKQQILNNKQL